MRQVSAQPRDQARATFRVAAGELPLARFAEEVRVPGARHLEVSVGVVHAHRTRGRRTIFPSVSRDYSDTPLPHKLGIKEDARVALQGAPEGFAERIGVKPRTRGELDVIVLFETKRGELTRAVTPLARRLAPNGGLWIAWPKKSAGAETDLSFEEVQRIGLKAGLVDNKSCSIDETWQAVRFVYRLADRP
jgi:hypothetical protein